MRAVRMLNLELTLSKQRVGVRGARPHNKKELVRAVSRSLPCACLIIPIQAAHALVDWLIGFPRGHLHGGAPHLIEKPDHLFSRHRFAFPIGQPSVSEYPRTRTPLPRSDRTRSFPLDSPRAHCAREVGVTRAPQLTSSKIASSLALLAADGGSSGSGGSNSRSESGKDSRAAGPVSRHRCWHQPVPFEGTGAAVQLTAPGPEPTCHLPCAN